MKTSHDLYFVPLSVARPSNRTSALFSLLSCFMVFCLCHIIPHHVSDTPVSYHIISCVMLYDIHVDWVPAINWSFRDRNVQQGSAKNTINMFCCFFLSSCCPVKPWTKFPGGRQFPTGYVCKYIIWISTYFYTLSLQSCTTDSRMLVAVHFYFNTIAGGRSK